jgi:16S rRNA (cytosine967-C5)-methyltransferase
LSADRPVGASIRAAAARIVARVLCDGVPADEALAAAPEHGTRDAPLLAALVLGALRWHHRLSWQAAQLLDRPIKPKQAELAALLRLGLLQLQEMRIPDHAAVSATVDAAAELGLRGASGLVNAVLRRFQRERAALDARLGAVPEAHFSHPEWFIDALRRDWPQAWQSVLEANNVQPPMWLRVSLRRVTREDYVEQLAAAGLQATASPHVEAAVQLAAPQPVESLPGFLEGLVSVQDAAAQLAPRFLALAPGQRVLDACAAPGGKTGHILEACPQLACVWALDRDADRLQKLNANLARLRLEATVVHGDAARPDDWWDGVPFDRVLLDAPCSATGVIRRHPDIKVLRRPEAVERAAELQRRLLEALWPVVKPGGRLVYATCSVLRRENADVILRFLSNTPDAELAPPAAVSGERGQQILPGEANMDGFYYACLDKQGVSRA